MEHRAAYPGNLSKNPSSLEFIGFFAYLVCLSQIATTMENTDILDPGFEKKLPQMLNVLTILTLIACGLGLLISLWGFFHAKDSYNAMLDMQSKIDEEPAFVQKLAGPDAVEVSRRTYINRAPILVVTLAGLACCTLGAIRMRRLKKSGFPLYVVGELLPLVSAMALTGAATLSGGSFAIGVVLAGVFIILYATQRKYLVA
jgi:hypothetical protein